MLILYVGERWQYVKVNTTWEDSGEITYSMGSHAYTYAGGVYFDHRSDTDGSSAIYYEGYMLDDYNGHSNGDPAYQYHYHAVSYFETFICKRYEVKTLVLHYYSSWIQFSNLARFDFSLVCEIIKGSKLAILTKTK